MKKARSSREPCSTRHALAIARWEDNRKDWLEGDYFGLTSERTDLQDLVGDGGTLWIIVSRGQSGEPRTYSLSFRLDKCRKHTYRKPGRFGPYSVVGDPDRSTLYASNDARLLLLSLRFDPFLPIDHSSDPTEKKNEETTDRLKIIGQSIQTPRCLNKADVKLLRDFGAETDRWSVFVSYQRTEIDTKIATKLSAAIQRHGVNVFRDQEALRPGQRWWPTLKRAVGRARHLVIVIGRTTHKSVWVKREVDHAIKKGVNVIPVLAGGALEHWADLRALHALTYKHGRWYELVRQVLAETHRASDLKH
jgi:hypothetical protein